MLAVHDLSAESWMIFIQAYNIAARMGRMGNSLYNMLGLSQSLQLMGDDPSAQSLSDASLQAFAFMSRELGRLMSTLTQARHQVWQAQSPLSEACRWTLCDLPVVPVAYTNYLVQWHSKLWNAAFRRIRPGSSWQT